MNCIKCQSFCIVTGASEEGDVQIKPDGIKKFTMSVKSPYILIDQHFSICLDCGFAWSKVNTDLETVKSVILRWGKEDLLQRLDLKEK